MQTHHLNDKSAKNYVNYELTHNGLPVAFAIRTMAEINERLKNEPDKPHRHNYYTVIWFEKGEGTHMIDFETFTIQNQTIYFVSPGQVHQVVAKGDAEGVVFMFTNDFLQRNFIPQDFISSIGLFSDFTITPPLCANNIISKKLTEISSHLVAEFKDNSPFKDQVLGAYLKLFLIESHQVANLNEENDANPQFTQAGQPIVLGFKQLLNDNFSKWHKVSDYASALNISPDYLNSIIKNYFGISAKESIQNRLVLEAKRLYIQTRLSAKEIAFELGFEDPAHFSKFFKTVDGVGFADFKKEMDLKL